MSVNMLKKTGFPEKASGDIGPTAMNGNSWRLRAGKLCGSRNDWYNSNERLSPPTKSRRRSNSVPMASPNPNASIRSCCRISGSRPPSVWLIKNHPKPYFRVSLTARRSNTRSRSASVSCSNRPLGACLCASSRRTRTFALCLVDKLDVDWAISTFSNLLSRRHSSSSVQKRF